MKKVTSILLLLLILTAMMQVSVATHFCGGKEVACIVSLDGKLADCGMGKNVSNIPVSGTSLESHCCENIITFCRTDNIYTPSVSFIPILYQFHLEYPLSNFNISGYSFNGLSLIHSNSSPPRILSPSDVDLSGICVFRI